MLIDDEIPYLAGGEINESWSQDNIYNCNMDLKQHLQAPQMLK
jgi:hypothetical protein